MSVIPEELSHKYKFEKKIGSGSYGTVYKVIDIFTGLYYALKVSEIDSELRDSGYSNNALALMLEHLIETSEMDFQAVQKILATDLSFPQYIQFTHEGNYSYILMDLFDGAILYNLHVRNLEKYKLTLPQLERMILKRLKQLLCQLYSLQKLKVVHMDIKPKNILISKTASTLIDFDFLCYTSESSEKDCKDVGTPLFASEERLFQPDRYPLDKSDVWSLAVSMLVLLIPDFSDMKLSHRNELHKFHKKLYDTLDNIGNETLKETLGLMLRPYKTRYKAKDVLKSMFMGETISNGDVNTIIGEDIIQR